MPIAARSTTCGAPTTKRGAPDRVELIGLPGGVSLIGLPEAERIRAALLAHGPPELRIEGDEVFHPIQAKPAPAP